MAIASISFVRGDTGVKLVLAIDGATVLGTSSYESVVRELHLRGVSQLSIEDRFATSLPTTPRTLEEASSIAFTEPMTALILIAACAAIDEKTAVPERRQRPRPELPAGGWRAGTASDVKLVL